MSTRVNTKTIFDLIQFFQMRICLHQNFIMLSIGSLTWIWEMALTSVFFCFFFFKGGGGGCTQLQCIYHFMLYTNILINIEGSPGLGELTHHRHPGKLLITLKLSTPLGLEGAPKATSPLISTLSGIQTTISCRKLLACIHCLREAIEPENRHSDFVKYFIAGLTMPCCPTSNFSTECILSSLTHHPLDKMVVFHRRYFQMHFH